MTREPPQDLAAERSLLGVMMLGTHPLAVGVDSCVVTDFYLPAHAAIFAAMVDMYRRGAPVDPVTVSAEMGHQGEQAARSRSYLIELMADAGITSMAGEYAAIVARHALARRIITVAADISNEAWRGDSDPADVLDHLKASIASLHAPQAGAPGDVMTWDAFWDRPGETHHEWAIPGMIRVGWKAIIVAGEGLGKTVATRQIALCAGQGIHPFTFVPIPQIRTLVIDLENPEEHLDLTGKMMRPPLTQTAGGMYQAYQTWLWHRPQGINVRSRQGRSTLESAISYVRPQLVVMSPLYKMFRKAAREDDEQAASDVQDVLDDLRARYEFALVIEHHAPKGVTKAREMIPFGSSLWMRWPETGLTLQPADNGSLIVDRYRPDRLPCRWPDRLDRGNPWPWVGQYSGGMPDAQGQIDDVAF